MKRETLSRTLALALALACVLAASLAPIGFAEDEAGTNDAQGALRVVEAKYVCMVNDNLFEREQIAVEVEERTYYGCCEMCKDRLARDEAIREAVDPVSGETVDKASAVIGAMADGKVLYFASQENLEEYNASHGS